MDIIEPEPWQIAQEQLRAEYAHLVPWRSPTELQDEVVWAYGRCEQTLREIRRRQKMSKYNDVRIQYGESIERTVDDIIDAVLSDNNIEQLDHEDTPVSSETWLACKAKVLALLATVTGEE